MGTSLLLLSFDLAVCRKKFFRRQNRAEKIFSIKFFTPKRREARKIESRGSSGLSRLVFALGAIVGTAVICARAFRIARAESNYFFDFPKKVFDAAEFRKNVFQREFRVNKIFSTRFCRRKNFCPFSAAIGGSLTLGAASGTLKDQILLWEGHLQIDRFLIVAAFAFLIVGMGFGGWMGAQEDFTFAPAHAHWNLLGFVASAIYGLIHRAYPALSASRLAWPQAIAHVVGTLIFTWGLMSVASAGTFAPILMSGPVLVILAALVFLIMFAMRSGRAASA